MLLTVRVVIQQFRLLAFYNPSIFESSTSSYTGKRECEEDTPTQLPQTGSSASLPFTFPLAVTQSHGPKLLQGRLENEVLCTQEGHMDGWASCLSLPSNCITSGPLNPRSNSANSTHPFTRNFSCLCLQNIENITLDHHLYCPHHGPSLHHWSPWQLL